MVSNLEVFDITVVLSTLHGAVIACSSIAIARVSADYLFHFDEAQCRQPAPLGPSLGRRQLPDCVTSEIWKKAMKGASLHSCVAKAGHLFGRPRPRYSLIFSAKRLPKTRPAAAAQTRSEVAQTLPNSGQTVDQTPSNKSLNISSKKSPKGRKHITKSRP